MSAKKLLKIDLSISIDEQKPPAAERRRNALRRKIANEAATLFEEYGGEESSGHDQITAEKIAERSDISVRTFFRYYQSKIDAIYVDVPFSIANHLALTSLWLERVQPAEASLAASVILLTNSLEDSTAAERLKRAMSSKTFVARRSSLRQEWRQSLAKLFEPHFSEQQDCKLISLTLAINTLNVREIAMDYWHWNDGKISVIDCFNKALSINHTTNKLEIPRAVSLISPSS